MDYIDKVLYPEQFQSSNIYSHPQFEDELKAIIEYSGFKNDFIRMYRQRLKFLHSYMNKCNQKRDWFEILKNSDGLYSMKFKGKKNIRIIFKFTGYNDCNIALLLCTFEEKNAKKNSKNSYNSSIKTAKDRYNEIVSK